MNERGAFRIFYSSLHDDPEARALSDRAFRVLVVLKSTLPAIGIGQLRFDVIAQRCNCTEDDVMTALAELEKPKRAGNLGWIARDRSLVWLVNGLRYEHLTAANTTKHKPYVARAYAELKNSIGPLPIVVQFQHYYREWFDALDPLPDGPSDTVTDRVSDTPASEPTGKTTKRSKAGAPEYDAAFETFWQEYPKPPGNKAKAARAFAKTVKGGVAVEHIMSRLALYKTSRDVTNGYVMNASTFVGPDRRFDDEFVPASDRSGDPVARLLALRDAQDAAICEGEELVASRLAG